MGIRVRQKPVNSGVWYVFVTWHGRRIAKKAGEYDTAEALAKKLELQMAFDPEAIFIKSEMKKPKPKQRKKIPNFKQLSEQWLEENENDWRESTYTRYVGVLQKYVWNQIGHFPVNEITKGDVKNVIAIARKAAMSRSTQEAIRTVIHAPLERAVDLELVDNNKAANALSKKKLAKEVKAAKRSLEPERVFTTEQMLHFLDVCKWMRPQYHALFSFLFQSGLRHGEAIALRWSNVDLGAREIKVSESLRYRRVTGTKTGAIRVVDILPETVKLLQIHRTDQKRRALEGRWNVPEIVFDFNGGYEAQNRVRRAYKKVLDAAKLPHHRVHDTRHSYCSQLVSRGVSTAYVAKQVGDTEEVVRKVYTHWIKDAAEPEVAALAGVWN